MPHRCAFGCKNTDVVMHVFPKPDKFPERFKVWVNLVGGKPETMSDLEFYRKKRVCDIHFPDEVRVRFKRLSTNAVPSLHLPVVAMSQDAENIDTIQPGTANPTAPIIQSGGFISQAPPMDIDDIQPGPSNKTASIKQSGVVIPQAAMDIDDIQPETANQTASNIQSVVRLGCTTTASVTQEHNYSVISRQKIIPKGAQEKTATYCYNKHNPLLKQKMKYLQSEICRLRKKAQTFKQRLANAEKLTNDKSFLQVAKHMTKPAQLFVHMQLQTKKNPKGRRFSIEEKVLCVSLFKKSPKCYRLLSKYFTLPSTKAMKRLLSQVKLVPGLNPIIFNKIKSSLSEADTCDRLCSLMFDEMSITPQITYNVHKDQIEGFATNQQSKFADHALVFMVKGIKRSFKQPIAYYFTNALNKIELKNVIKCVAQQALDSGLIILNTVCDQSQVNVGAINELVSETKATYLRRGKEWTRDIFKIKGKTIIPLYDTPHLFKGLRNNLLTKDLLYYTNNVKKVVKWEYYQMVHAADKSYGELRLLDKITEEHINPEKINKMRVKTATQLFSQSVAVVTDHLTARGDLPEECRQLVDITILLNNLFDSLNVSSFIIPNGKVFKGPVKRFSPHHQLWSKAKEILKTVKFIKKNNVGDKVRFIETIVPSVTNLIKTIEGIESLWKLLSEKYGLDTMLTRNFNQDPIENFFGNIRSYGARNIAPNTASFEGAFKALMLNNFNAPHSMRANCEADDNDCLQKLDFFLKDKNVAPDVPDENEEIFFNNELITHEHNEEDRGQSNYVCGWVLKKCLKGIVKGCQDCKSDLLDNESVNKNNEFIKAKEYQNKKWLCYPNSQTENFFRDSQKVVCSYLKKNLSKKRLKETILSLIDVLVECPFKCPTHKENFKKMFLDTTLNVLIYSWCRSVNRILNGKINYDGDDETKIAAQIYYNKHKNYKNRK